MKYGLILILWLWSTNLQAQIAHITSEGTTAYTEKGEVFTPSVQAIALQKMQQEQQAAQARQAAQVRQAANQAYQEQEKIKVKQQKKVKVEKPKKRIGKSLTALNGNQKTALDLLVLQEVANYKLNDETIRKDVSELKDNPEYYRKIEKIREKLTNGKFPNSLNKEVLRILEDTGNRLYNMLGN